jgi:hypothetical protein
VPAPSPQRSTGAEAAYSERLRLPFAWWLLGAFFVISVGWAFFVATPRAATLVAVLVTATLVTLWLVSYGSVMIRVDDEELRAGRATLPRSQVGAVQPLDAEATRRALGRDADARAFLVTRPYCRTAVRVEVLDETDPTPYWLISTRHPARLSASLHPPHMQD